MDEVKQLVVDYNKKETINNKYRQNDSLQGNKYYDLITDSINNIRHGSVIISIQDGKIIQVEKQEKFRINN